MENLELTRLYHQLDTIQRNYLNVLKAQASAQESVFSRIQLKDMVQLIEMDIKSRADLELVADMIPRVQLSEAMYGSFLGDMTTILTELAGCTIPHDIANAYKVIGDAIQGQPRLNPRDIFTCISITLTVVSLCINQMPLVRQQETLGILDHLLEVKTSQLELLEETARFYKDFSENNPFQ